VVIAGAGDSDAKQFRVLVHGGDDGHQESQKLRVGVGGRAGLQQVLALVGSHGPVVVLPASVNALEGLLVQEADQAVPQGDLAHEFHDHHVVVRREGGFRVKGRHLELGRRHFVMTGLGKNP